MLDRQKAFDTMVAHLRRQGKRAVLSSGSCRYRTEDGLKCAVGALIPDELYTDKIEGLAAGDLKVLPLIPGAEESDIAFLDDAQYSLHDQNYNEELGCFIEHGFRVFAMDWELEYKLP